MHYAAVAVGVVTAALTAVFSDWLYAPAVGWDTAAGVFCACTWMAIWPLPPGETAARATEEDPSRALTDVLILSACLASLAAVGMVLVQAHSAPPAGRAVLAGLSLASVTVSWFTLHTVFTLRYAMLYYSPPAGGIDFNQSDPPGYRDFAYLALTLGMTYQVSDTSLKTSLMRSTAIRHALMSYLFGAVILATAINLIAGLGMSGPPGR